MTDQIEPTHPELPSGPQADLVSRVRAALLALPGYFESTTNIEGLEAQDLFAVSSVLGGTIEVQVVATLNRLRNLWDDEDRWSDYRFERFAQTFPDVQLGRTTPTGWEPILGIELKGWYLLSKEMEPSFRYRATPDACSKYDLLVIVPWHLKDVLTGTPVVHTPFIESARYAADYRNYYWQHERKTKRSTIIDSPSGVSPYPDPKTNISDSPQYDGGSNFGRIARTGLTDSWTELMLKTRLAGINVRHWVQFLKAYAETTDPNAIERRVDLLIQSVQAERDAVSSQVAEVAAERIRDLVNELATELNPTAND